MLHHVRFLLLAGLAFAVAGATPVPALAATLTRTETFDSDLLDQFDEFGGTHVNGNDFGFSNTNNVGLSGGEAGGTMARSQTIRAYADLDLGGTLHRNENLHIEGSFRLTDLTFDGALMIGFFNTADTHVAGGLPFIGLTIWEPWKLTPPTETFFRAFPNLWETGGSLDGLYQDFSSLIELDPNVTHSFSFDWAANSDGSGLLSATIDGQLMTVTIHSTVLDSYNAFGVGTGMSVPPYWEDPPPESELQAQLFADNLTYSIVPEPGSIVLMAAGMVVLVATGWRKRLRSQRGGRLDLETHFADQSTG